MVTEREFKDLQTIVYAVSGVLGAAVVLLLLAVAGLFTMVQTLKMKVKEDPPSRANSISGNYFRQSQERKRMSLATEKESYRNPDFQSSEHRGFSADKREPVSMNSTDYRRGWESSVSNKSNGRNEEIPPRSYNNNEVEEWMSTKPLSTFGGPRNEALSRYKDSSKEVYSERSWIPKVQLHKSPLARNQAYDNGFNSQQNYNYDSRPMGNPQLRY